MSARAARRFASRGGDKLDGALEALGIDVRGARALDAGASTGGFTDCLLSRGAREVVAVDVAYGALDWRLRNDPRVHVLERTNVRHLSPQDAGGPVDLVIADLSFISLRTVADALVRLCRPAGALLLMVKPQFELPRERVPRGGVVRDRAAWLDALASVVETYRRFGCALAGAAPSTLPGPKGNREFFVHLRRDEAAAFGSEAADGDVLAAAIEGAP